MNYLTALRLGAARNNNSRRLARLGPDTGFDSIGDQPQAAALARYLDKLDRDDRLPKTVRYNVHPSDNYVFATVAGNFQDGSVPGKIQYGGGWLVSGSKGRHGMADQRPCPTSVC